MLVAPRSIRETKVAPMRAPESPWNKNETCGATAMSRWLLSYKTDTAPSPSRSLKRVTRFPSPGMLSTESKKKSYSVFPIRIEFPSGEYLKIDGTTKDPVVQEYVVS